ncbi:MAG: hypothetical protein RIC95_01475 [Vicingaceae bacterium]
MSKVNPHNYEAFFLDYLEGKLSAREKAEVDAFLEKHPELKAELEEFETISLDAETVKMPKADLLREEETGLSRKDYLLIASVEGTLSKTEKTELDKLLEVEPNLLDELSIYEKTKLPEENLAFGAKEDLKQKEGRVIYWQFYAASASVAAAILALFMFNFNSVQPRYEFEAVEKSNLYSDQTPEAEFQYVIEEAEKQKEKNKTNLGSPQAAPIYAQASKPKPTQKQKPLNQEEEKQPKEMLQAMEQEAPNFAEEQKSPQPMEVEKMKLPEENSLAALEEDKVISNQAVSAKEIPLKEYATQKLKEEVLQNKSVSQALADEIAALTNDKVNFSTDKSDKKKGLQFAMNLGNFSISKK